MTTSIRSWLMNKSYLKMKHFILTVVLLALMQGAAAQNKRGGFTPERFQAELEQYISKKACLTPKEASKFFPVYSEMLARQRTVHKKMRDLKRIKPASDSECRKNIKKRDELEIEIKEIQKVYHDKFMQILPARKVYDVLNAEDKFHRQMFKKAARRKRGK